MRPKFGELAVGDRRAEVHLVERVEQLATELKPHALASGKREQSRHGDVGLRLRGSADRALRHVAVDAARQRATGTNALVSKNAVDEVFLARVVAPDVVNASCRRQTCASCRPAPPVPSSATSVPIVKFSGLPLDQLCTPLTVQPLADRIHDGVVELAGTAPTSTRGRPRAGDRTAIVPSSWCRSNGFATPAVSPAP